jgi:hypothetical protein
MNDIAQKCVNCDKPLKGRTDKKYCDDNCRNEYFNKQKEIERKEIRTIDIALKRNRRILKEVLKEKESVTVPEKQLQEKGFVFHYHTHHLTTKTKQHEYLFCYDYGYHALGNGYFKVIKAFSS